MILNEKEKKEMKLILDDLRRAATARGAKDACNPGGTDLFLFIAKRSNIIVRKYTDVLPNSSQDNTFILYNGE